MRHLWIGVSVLIAAAVPPVAAAETVARHTLRTSDGVRLSVLEAGVRHKKEGGLALAFIPGWCMPAELWRRQVEALADRYYTTAVDPRGQGRSDVPRQGYTAERRAGDIDEFLRPLT